MQRLTSDRRFLRLFALWMLVTQTLAAQTTDTSSGAPKPGLVDRSPQEQAESIKRQQYDVAKQLTTDFPDEFEAIRIVGFVHSSHGNLEEMAKCWKRCHELQPQRADVLDQLGRHAAQEERYGDAMDYWQQAISIKPKLAGLRVQLASTLMTLGRLEEASNAIREEHRLFPPTAESQYVLGEIRFQQGQFPAAKEAYLAAVAIDARHGQSLYGLVRTCARLEQTEESAKYAAEFQALDAAINEADAAHRRAFDDLRSMRQRLAITCTEAGTLYLHHQQPRRAEQLWTQAAAADPQQVASRAALTQLYRAEKRFPDAVRQLEDLLRIEPGNLEYLQQLGFAHASTGDLKSAEKTFARMIEAAPKQSDGYRMLAKFYLNINRQLPRALKLAEQAAKLDQTAETQFVLGWAQAKSGQFKRAETSLKDAIRQDPKNPLYRKLLDSLPRK